MKDALDNETVPLKKGKPGKRLRIELDMTYAPHTLTSVLIQGWLIGFPAVSIFMVI